VLAGFDRQQKQINEERTCSVGLLSVQGLDQVLLIKAIGGSEKKIRRERVPQARTRGEEWGGRGRKEKL